MIGDICQKQSHWLEQFITIPGLTGSAGPPAAVLDLECTLETFRPADWPLGSVERSPKARRRKDPTL